LRAVGWAFEVVEANIDESREHDENATTYVKRLAHAKALTVANKLAGKLVLGADTVVVVGGEILGQPRNEDDARRMLRLLSGVWHELLTGVALVRNGQDGGALVAHQTTEVRFAELSTEELDWYVSTGEPMDKAGAYAIQGKAAPFIQEIRGDYFNIVGLPISLVYQLLQQL